MSEQPWGSSWHAPGQDLEDLVFVGGMKKGRGLKINANFLGDREPRTIP